MENLTIHCIVAKYDKKHNATAEFRVKTLHDYNQAEKWLTKINKPAMFYIDGLQNTDSFLTFGCKYNEMYWNEHRKEID